MDFYRIWRPVQIRYYRMGSQMLLIYTLGWGQAKGYKAYQDEDLTKNMLPLEKFIEGNDVMMHGQRFDFWQIL